MMRVAGWVVACLLLTHSSAFAHKLLVTTRVEGNEVRVDVYYEDDSPADGAKMQLLQGEQLLAEGRANDEGKWAIPRPGAGLYVLRAEHYGHVILEPVAIPATDDPAAGDKSREPTGARIDRLAIGLVVIAALFVMYWLICRRDRRSPSPNSTGD